MKKIVFIVTVLVMTGATLAQDLIKIGTDACSHCNMFIKDQQFAAVAVDQDGSTQKFDAIECLVNYLKDEDESSFKKLMVADYEMSGSIIDAKNATYLKSKNIASPMGAYLSAYVSKEVAEKVQRNKGGELYNWEELKKKFIDSRFGLLDHPTHHHNRPDAYAPIGIMGDHLHHKGGFMVSVRYMTMEMEGNLSGSDEVNDMIVFQNYMVAPQAMRMDMLMIGVMYAPSDRLTLMLMQNFQRNQMDLSTMMGMNFSTKSEGIGDLKISALYGLFSESTHSWHLNVGVSIPTGSIKNQGDTPMAEGMRLPYPMQLGTGTVDLTFGGTYKGSSENVSWGVQPLATIRTGDNTEGYKWGNEFVINTWVGYNLAEWVSVAGQFSAKKQTQMQGRDEMLNPMMVTTADTKNTGFTKVYSNVALNFSFGESPVLRDFKAGLSYGLPVYQKVKGIQMNEQDAFTIGLRYAI
ncbi:nitrous oxide reductase accessory protein NosL [Ekhidna sp.]|uniref:nitrous oxide reductase accessory protein NosL n=1 Tax=Ekhidna sp. TaxID=2608089 RepID=UPI003BACF82B